MSWYKNIPTPELELLAKNGSWLAALVLKIRWNSTKIPTEHGCIEWVGNRVSPKKIYGSAWLDGYPTKCVLVNRIALGLEVGYVEPNLDAAHNCHNTICVEGEHLSWKTRKENHQQSLLDGKLLGNAKLTLQQMELITWLLQEPSIAPVDIAILFNVAETTISNIKTGYTWKGRL